MTFSKRRIIRNRRRSWRRSRQPVQARVATRCALLIARFRRLIITRRHKAVYRLRTAIVRSFGRERRQYRAQLRLDRTLLLRSLRTNRNTSAVGASCALFGSISSRQRVLKLSFGAIFADRLNRNIRFGVDYPKHKVLLLVVRFGVLVLLARASSVFRLAPLRVVRAPSLELGEDFSFAALVP